ncbi:MFS transporter [Cysteiniphilum halobium]|uniref:MFS transporter n=1 Tax=Cysteiniphilum halobium TaxID=2219059 RepID=UPI000E656F50|nr:MFS transporter [Cysteiniphilum halobium]
MKNSKVLLYLLILVGAPVFGVGVDLYTPSLPSITHYFDCTLSMSKLSMSSYLFGGFIGMLFLAALSDSYGRKKMMSICMLGMMLSCFITIFSQTILEMIVLRFLAGLFAGGAAALNRAIFTDIFSDPIEIKKASASILLAWGCGPVIAPFLGGYLQHYFSWKASFIFLAIYSVIVLIMTFIFMSDRQQIKIPFSIKALFSRYMHVLSHKVFVSSLVQSGLLYATLIYFPILGTFYVQHILHFSPVVYGYLALLLGIGFMLGCLFRKRLIHIKDHLVKKYLMIIMSVLTVIGLFLSLIFSSSLSVVMVCIWIVSFIVGIVFSVHFGHLLSIFPKIAGTAGSVSSASNMFVLSIVSVIISLFQVYSGTQLILVYIATIILLILFSVIIRAPHKHLEPLAST